MQYHVSNYGVFTQLCPQVLALDDNTSLATEPAVSVANKSIFTLGLNGQANTVAGIAGGKRYASNLKWAYPSLPTTDEAIHQGVEVSDGCSRGNSDSDLAWSNKNTVFITDSPDDAIWSYGKVSCSTGATSPSLTATLFLYNGTKSVIAERKGRVTFNDYVITSEALNFKYAFNILISINASSYAYRLNDGVSDMRMFYSVDAPDQVKEVAKYECIRAGKLFRFTPQELNFGALVAGTRPIVKSYMKARYLL